MAVFRLLLMSVLCGFSSAFLETASPSSVYQRTTSYIDRHYVTEHNLYGTINTPNYPGNYPDNTIYVYDIGRFQYPLRLVFKSFSVEYCLGCQCDNVTIKPSHRADNLQVYCGSTLPHGDGVLYFSGPIQITFRSNSVYGSSGFQARYEVGAMASTMGSYPSAVTTLRPASKCPPATCITCGPGYESRIIYSDHCPECVCVPKSSSSALPAVSTCPPATCPTCSRGYVPRINYSFFCPFCECVYEGTSWNPFSIWTTPMTFPPPASHSLVPVSTWPPVSTYPPPRSILSSLFRIHGELSDLQDKAKAIDNDVIDLIQQIEGGNFGHRRSLLLEAIGDSGNIKQDVAEGSEK